MKAYDERTACLWTLITSHRSHGMASASVLRNVERGQVATHVELVIRCLVFWRLEKRLET